jgi:hypothetical protein
MLLASAEEVGARRANTPRSFFRARKPASSPAGRSMEDEWRTDDVVWPQEGDHKLLDIGAESPRDPLARRTHKMRRFIDRRAATNVIVFQRPHGESLLYPRTKLRDHHGVRHCLLRNFSIT